MNIDAELEVWRRQWQSEAGVPLDLRRKVERQSRFMKIGLAADTLVTIVIGGGAAVWALVSWRPDTLLLSVATWLFIAAAWAFSLTVNRGNWSPSGLDTAAYVDLSVRRCRARLAAVRFGAGLFVVQMVFCLGWVYRHAPEPRMPVWNWLLFSSLTIDVVWLLTLVFAAFVVWFRARKKRELAYFLNLRLQMMDEPPPQNRK